MNYLVEIKKEYTITLVNILTPLIFQGLQSIYKDAKNISKNEDVLKNFQTFLREVPKWNNDLINRETNRILSNSRCADWLHDLIKAVVKSNIIILTNNFMYKKNISGLNEKYYEQIDMNDFIHKVYIECAREVWNNPYLFFDEYSPIDLKRNQRDTIALIKDSIREAIRKMLPVKHILKEYLGNNFEKENYADFESSITEAKSKNIRSLLKKDITNKIIENKFEKNEENLNLPIFSATSDNNDINENENEKDIDITLENILDQQKDNNNLNQQKGGNIEDLKNMNKEDIINQLKEEEKRESLKSNRNSYKSSYAASSQDETTFDQESKVTNLKNNSDNPNKNNIKSILENELYDNVSEDSDTSISYTHGNFNDESFEDVFSNINGDKNVNKNKDVSIGSEIFLNNLLNESNDNNKKTRKEYFSSYAKH